MKMNNGKVYLWIWVAWLLLFYGVWSLLVFVNQQWPLVMEHWPIALAMTVGSYAAGSTPMGGGTVGFPVMVMVFDMPATLGRDFSFAIQSIGMVSAGIFILVRRQPVAYSILSGALLGSFLGTPIGILYVAPHFADIWIKLMFSMVWGSFGILHLIRIREISTNQGLRSLGFRTDFKLGFAVTFLTSVFVSSVTGVGVDMVLYCILVLLYRSDLKIAIPTSVLIMAFTSVVGVATKMLTGGFHPSVYGNWLAAAPVVIIGAPFGVFVVNLIGRKPTLVCVAFLCMGQYLWTCMTEYRQLGEFGITVCSLVMIVLLSGFEYLRIKSMRLSANAT
ncbi:MAG: sulfite exporter TauE/SafE family protein [Exilibacterium sp.]